MQTQRRAVTDSETRGPPAEPRLCECACFRRLAFCVFPRAESIRFARNPIDAPHANVCTWIFFFFFADNGREMYLRARSLRNDAVRRMLFRKNDRARQNAASNPLLQAYTPRRFLDFFLIFFCLSPPSTNRIPAAVRIVRCACIRNTRAFTDGRSKLGEWVFKKSAIFSHPFPNGARRGGRVPADRGKIVFKPTSRVRYESAFIKKKNKNSIYVSRQFASVGHTGTGARGTRNVTS